jgi:hypothetical protein
VVNDEGVAEGEEEQGAAQQQAADRNAEVAARHTVTGGAAQPQQHDAYRMAVERNDSKDESVAAAFVPARSRHTNVPATPIPCQPLELMRTPSHAGHGLPS